MPKFRQDYAGEWLLKNVGADVEIISPPFIKTTIGAIVAEGYHLYVKHNTPLSGRKSRPAIAFVKDGHYMSVLLTESITIISETDLVMFLKYATLSFEVKTKAKSIRVDPSIAKIFGENITSKEAQKEVMAVLKAHLSGPAIATPKAFDAIEPKKLEQPTISDILESIGEEAAMAYFNNLRAARIKGSKPVKQPMVSTVTSLDEYRNRVAFKLDPTFEHRVAQFL